MRLPGRPAATLALVLLAAAPGGAADHLVAGRKLLLKTPASGAAGNRLVHLGTDAGIAMGQPGGPADPRCVGAGGGGTSSLRVATAGGGGATIPLPCSGWSTNGAKTAYRYKDASGATCKLVMVKDGALVKAVCKGAQVAVALGAGVAPVSVVTTLNADRFCTQYGGTAVHDGSDGTTLLYQDAPAPGSCPTSSTATTATSTTTSTTLACCILYAGQCTWTPSEVDCFVGGGVSTGDPGSVCDGVTGGCTSSASPGYCCAFPDGSCTSGPTGDAGDCVDAGGTVHASARCMPDGACVP